MKISNGIFFFFIIFSSFNSNNNEDNNDNKNKIISYNYILFFFNGLEKEINTTNKYFNTTIEQSTCLIYFLKQIFNNNENNSIVDVLKKNQNFQILEKKNFFFSAYIFNTINIYYKSYLKKNLLNLFNDVFMNQKKFYNNWLVFQDYIINLNNELINQIDKKGFLINNIKFINDFLFLYNIFLKKNNEIIFSLGDNNPLFMDLLKLKMCSCENEFVLDMKSVYLYPYYLKFNIDKFNDPNIKEYFYFFDFEKYINNSNTIFLQSLFIKKQYINFILNEFYNIINNLQNINNDSSAESILDQILEYYNFIMKNIMILYKIFKELIIFLYEFLIIYNNNDPLISVDNLFTKIEIIEKSKDILIFNEHYQTTLDLLFLFKTFVEMYITYNEIILSLFSSNKDLINVEGSKKFLEIFIQNQIGFFLKFLGKNMEIEKEIKELFNIFVLKYNNKSEKQCNKHLKLFLMHDYKTNVLALNKNKDNPILSTITIFPINDFINILSDFILLMEPEINLN